MARPARCDMGASCPTQQTRTSGVPRGPVSQGPLPPAVTKSCLAGGMHRRLADALDLLKDSRSGVFRKEVPGGPESGVRVFARDSESIRGSREIQNAAEREASADACHRSRAR